MEIVKEENGVVNHAEPFLISKRKLDGDDTVEVKRKKVEEEQEVVKVDSLLSFSDDILLMIVQNLQHRDLLMLSRTCDRLSRICGDHTLWREVVFLDSTSQEELDEILKYMTDKTKGLFATSSEQRSRQTASDCLHLRWVDTLCMNCPNLLELALQRFYINCFTVQIQNYPRSLIKLDLSETQLKNEPINRSYFKDISLLMPHLEVLILSNCLWFEPHSLMALSKCPRLTELRLNGCYKVRDCVAYCGLATRSGFKSLKVLDLRKCPIGNSELICFASVSTITDLYLEYPVHFVQGDGPFIDQPLRILFTNDSLIEIRAGGMLNHVSYPRLKIEKLVVQNYKLMTDESIVNLARDASNLKFLDVTGSGVSEHGKRNFVNSRPDVTFLC